MLSTLPKTLHDTYERILLEIPEEDVKLARDTLLFLDGFKTYSGQRRPELFPPGDFPEFFYCRSYVFFELEPLLSAHDGCRILSESCGCLIKDLGHELEFTHYTVREFLASPHLTTHSNAKLRFFALESDRVYHEFSSRLINIVWKLQYKIMARNPPLPDQICDTTPDYLTILHFPLENIAACIRPHLDVKRMVNPSMESLVRQFADLFTSEQSAVVSRFASLSLPGGHRWQDDTAWRLEDMDRLQLHDENIPTRRHVRAIALMTLLGSERLTTLILEGIDAAKLFDMEVTMDFKVKGNETYYPLALEGASGGPSGIDRDADRPRLPIRSVSGNLLLALGCFREHLLLEGRYGYDPVGHLITSLVSMTPNPIDMTELLMHYLATQYDRRNPPAHMFLRYGEDPTLARLLDRGADPNAAGYALTPLQLAAEFKNLECLLLLLEGGADPNGVGEVGGKLPKGQGLSLRWSSASPLKVNREAPHPLEEIYLGQPLKSLRGFVERNMRAIANILEERSGRDFSGDGI